MYIRTYYYYYYFSIYYVSTLNSQPWQWKPTPWAFMLGNCFGWLTYSVLIQNLFVFFGNAPGLCISLWLNLQASKMQYETFRSNEWKALLVSKLEQKHTTVETGDDAASPLAQSSSTGSPEHDNNILIDLTLVPKKMAPAPHDHLVLLNVVFWLAIVSLLSFSKAASLSDDTTQKWIVGMAVNFNLLVFYAAPLSTIWTVLKMRSAATIHVPTMLTNTFNGCFWGAYGVAIFDWFIAVPNVLGAMLGAVQIVLYVLFSRY